MIRIAVLDDYQGVARTFGDWSLLGPDVQVEVFRAPLATEDEAAAALAGFDVVCLMRERLAVPASLLDRLPKLRLLLVTGARVRVIDLEAAVARGITVCHTSAGESQFATPELAWALLLAAARHLPQEHQRMREGGWQETVGTTLGGKTLGLVGLGKLGARMVPIARAFGMDVIAWSQNLTDERAAEVGVPRVTKDALFQTADAVSIHMQLGPRSTGLVGAAEIALMTPGAILVNTSRGPNIDEAALLAARRGKRVVGMEELEDAKDKVLMGAERKSMVMQKSEKELTAYHEAGHAITALNCPNSDPIHKATIIPRGRALGLVMRLPEHDRFSVTRAKLKDDLIVAFGGRAAEELIFGYEQVTTGASSDIQQATSMARAMVTKWGLSDKVGVIDYGEDDGSRFYAANKPYSQETGRIIDEEVKRIISEGLAEAKKILNEKKDDLEKLARALLEYETLSGEEIKDLLAGKEIRKPSTQSGSAASAISEGLIPKVS